MIQVYSKDWKSFGLDQVFTENDWTYVRLIRLPPYLRNVDVSQGEIVWVLQVDSNDSGGSVNSSARVIAELVKYARHSNADVLEDYRNLDLRWLREASEHTGVLGVVDGCPPQSWYSGEDWLKSIE